MKRDMLFYTLLLSYVVAFIVTILGITGLIPLDADAKPKLVIALIVEVAASILALYNKTDFFTSDDEARRQKVEEEIEALNSEILRKDSDLRTCQSEAKEMQAHLEKIVHGFKFEVLNANNRRDDAFEELAKYKKACEQTVEEMQKELVVLRAERGETDDI